jgi:hypothetical protein
VKFYLTILLIPICYIPYMGYGVWKCTKKCHLVSNSSRMKVVSCHGNVDTKKTFVSYTKRIQETDIQMSTMEPICRVILCGAVILNKHTHTHTYIYIQTNKQTPWSESASELHRPSDSRFSAKWLPTFEDKGCQVVSVTDPYGRILDFLDRSRYLFIK